MNRHDNNNNDDDDDDDNNNNNYLIRSRKRLEDQCNVNSSAREQVAQKLSVLDDKLKAASNT